MLQAMQADQQRSNFGGAQDAVTEEVYAQLSQVFPPDAVAWVWSVPWEGPEAVSMGDVDASNRQNWVASHEPEKVQGFVQTLEQTGELEPVVLYRTPDGALHAADGHHRLLAYESAGEDPVAYVADVPEEDGPWAEMHSQQNLGPSFVDDDAGAPSSRPGANMGDWARRAVEPGA